MSNPRRLDLVATGVDDVDGNAFVLAGLVQDFDEDVVHALILPGQAVMQADQLPIAFAS